MALTSMRRTPKLRGTIVTEQAVPEEERWPYGLRIHLEEEDLERLGFGDLPGVGTEMGLKARVVVKSAGVHDGSDGKKRNLELQIVAMDLGGTEQIAEKSTEKALVHVEDG